MRWSKIKIKTLKESPIDTVLPSHSLLVRGAFIQKLSSGLFTYGPFMVRAIQKFENILREELNKKSCAEILMPIVQPKEIWTQSERWDLYDDLLQKMKNRQGQEFCLGPTHEEVISTYAKKNIKSYRDLPFCFYQIQTKFRDEIRPRFGLMRAREFIMKDAYSFDSTEEQAKKSYQKMKAVYDAIFSRLNTPFRIVKADSGEIGGDLSEEFHILASHGEDELLLNDSFAANKEICPVFIPEDKKEEANNNNPLKQNKAPLQDIEEFHTPGIKTIKALAKSLKVKEKDLVKIIFLKGDFTKHKNIAILLNGNDELNLFKVKKHFHLEEKPHLLNKEEVKAISGADPGSCGPVGLNIPVYIDQTLLSSSFITGANKDDYHIRNVKPGRDFSVTGKGDFRYARSGDKGPDGTPLKLSRGIEVGHIFYLGDKYSKKMDVFYLDHKGNKQSVKMGCYGIGVTRVIQAVVEHSHDKEGIIWPMAISPFTVHISLLDPEDPKTADCANKLYQDLTAKKIDVFLDDRVEKPGVKFKDADLLGFPLRINIGARDNKRGLVEIVNRATKTRDSLSIPEAIEKVKNYVSKMLQ